MTAAGPIYERIHALRDELSKAQSELAEQVRRENEAYAKEMVSRLTPQFIDMLAPKHSRTSCSDLNLSNADFYRSRDDSRLPRCMRCFLLDVSKTLFWPEDIRLNVTLMWAPDPEWKP
jgi:hypothetical protein